MRATNKVEKERSSFNFAWVSCSKNGFSGCVAIATVRGIWDRASRATVPFTVWDSVLYAVLLYTNIT